MDWCKWIGVLWEVCPDQVFKLFLFMEAAWWHACIYACEPQNHVPSLLIFSFHRIGNLAYIYIYIYIYAILARDFNLSFIIMDSVWV